MTHYIACVADTHANSTVGLCPPILQLSGGEHRSTDEQRGLWRNWLDFWEWVEKEINGGDLTTIFDGDMIEGDIKQRTYETITRNKTDIEAIALEVVEIPVRLSKRVVFIRGTPAHVGKSGYYEEWLASDCDTAVHSKRSASWVNLQARIGGLTLDIQHHGRVGTQPRGKLTPLLSLANALMYHAPRPNLAIRAHCHRYADTGDNHPIRVIQLPCWQLPNDYACTLTGANPPDIGGILIRIDGNEWTIQKRLYPIRTSQPLNLTN